LKSFKSSNLRLIVVISAILSLSLAGCAGSIPAAPKEDRSPADPWEPLNRRISNFNDGLDKVTLRPLARGYQAVLPDPMQRGIANFSNNLRGPLYIINNLLQGKFKRSLNETGRFLANSTWGLLGFVDVGADLGMETYREDFGQTLAVWGVPDGPFVVIPVLGPRTLRDATMIPLNFLADPLFHYNNDTARRWIYAVRLVDVRARLFSVDALIEDSFDRYLTIRESYLQNRLFLIFDGNPPEDDDFYDDFFDEEFEEEEDPQ
jgi:phospholipid-binding lipoprotein MlaA